MAEHFYDIQKMLRDDMTDLVKDAEDLKNRWEKEQYYNENFLAEEDEKMNAREREMEALGIDIRDIKRRAEIKGIENANKWISENNKSIVTHSDSKQQGNLRYEDLVNKALERNYVNTTIHELLNESEIKEADARLQLIEAEFARKTKLNKQDRDLLITATAFQVIRQYVIDPWIKGLRRNAGPLDEKAHGKMDAGWYWVDTKKILLNTVPFDSVRYGNYESVNGFLKGHKNHREATLGHDPILGWIFGTMNIMTGTVTNSEFRTAHVKYVPGKGNVIHSMASTEKMVRVVQNRVCSAGMDGKIALGCAILREAEHLKSDALTKHGLPLPFINSIDAKLGETLCQYGIETTSIATEMTLAELTNMVISMIHRILKKDSENEKLYQTRTRKIILYSNLIASTSNLIVVGIGTLAGGIGENPELVKQSISKLDIGGLLVTIAKLFTNLRFISEIKHEFIMNEIDKPILREIEYLDRLLAAEY